MGYQDRYNAELQCNVIALAYTCRNRLGTIWMDEYSCASMTGAIKFFERIDPDVERIETFNVNKPDTFYFKIDGEWVAAWTN